MFDGFNRQKERYLSNSLQNTFISGVKSSATTMYTMYLLELNRDNYVKILKQNIQGQMVYNFDKMNLYQIDLLKAKYDTCSVMHYNEYAFSRVWYFKCLLRTQAEI